MEEFQESIQGKSYNFDCEHQEESNGEVGSQMNLENTQSNIFFNLTYLAVMVLAIATTAPTKTHVKNALARKKEWRKRGVFTTG